MNIAFIGLGHMGTPMAMHLIPHHQLTVFDIFQAATTPFKETTARIGLSIAETIAHADVVITMLPTGKEVKTVYLDLQGILNHAKPNTLLIDCSTIDVLSSRWVHEAAQRQGYRMVDAPVSGGTTGAAAGTLTFMVGGTEDAFSDAKPILSHMGKHIFHTGPAGTGQTAKICNNMMLGINMIGVSEAFCLANKLGLNAQTLFDITKVSSGQSWALTSYHPLPDLVLTSPANRNYEPGFTANMMLKDLILSQMAAQESHSPTPLGAEATSLYMLFEKQGFGQLDFSGIVKMFQGKN